MKKKIVALFLIGALSCAALSACGEPTSKENNVQTEQSQASEETSEATQDEAPQESAEEQDDGVIDFEADGFSVKYISHEFGTDWDGNNCLIYYYTFTNTSEENTSAGVASYFQCFQNGISCDTSFPDEDNEYYNNYSKTIQPGTSIDVCEYFILQDESEITLEASDWVSFSDEKDTQKITFE